MAAMTQRQLLLLAALALPISLTAQLEIATGYSTGSDTDFGKIICAIGDGNGDGTPDFVVHGTTIGPQPGARLQLISGATRAPLGQVIASPFNFGAILNGTDDLDLDGNHDFIAGFDTTLRAYSGANAALLWTSNLAADFYCACGIGDIDNDSRAEIAAGVRINGTYYIVILRGSDGSQLGNTATIQGYPEQIIPIGDLNGNGQTEVVIRTSSTAQIYRTVSPFRLRTITPPLSSLAHLEAANVAGNADSELIISRSGRLFTYVPFTGQLLRTDITQNHEFTVVGDLNSDGFDDLALIDSQTRHGFTPDGSLILVSGATGAYLANWSRSSFFGARVLTGAGDLDGDGFGDLLLGDQSASATGGTNGDGAFQLVSCRIQATTFSIPVNCHGGPFPPELGMSRPIIGQTASIIGRDCPANAWGFLALSLKPEHPISLGFSGCDAWFDISNGLLVHQQPPAISWSFGLPIPNALQLSGLSLALQALYLPSTSPIGMDLSNGIWARIGGL